MGGAATKRKDAAPPEPAPPPLSDAERTRQRRQTLQQNEASKRVRRPSLAKIDWTNDEMVDMQQKILEHPAELEDFSQFMMKQESSPPVQFYLAIFEYTHKFGYDPPPADKRDAAVAERFPFVQQIYETFVKDGAPEVGLSEKTRTTFMTSMEAKDVSGAVFSRAKGEVIAMLARKHLKDFVELQESKFNVAAGGDGAVETETKEECALEAHGAALMVPTEQAKTHFAQDSKQLLKEISKIPGEKATIEAEANKMADDIAKIRSTRKTAGRTFFRKTNATRTAAPALGA